MNTSSESKPTIKSLSARIIRYDYRRLKAEAEAEFDTTVTSKELVDQEFIGQIFKLKGKSDERN